MIRPGGPYLAAGAALSVALLTACAPQPAIGPAAPLAPPAAPLCDAARYQALLGQPASALDPKTLPTSRRIVCADCAMTMDYAADRLTIRLDADAKVAGLACQ